MTIEVENESVGTEPNQLVGQESQEDVGLALLETGLVPLDMH